MRKLPLVLAASVAAIGAIYAFNASWRVAPPSDLKIGLIAHRGIHQTYNREGLDNETCTAARIDPPVHDYLENTLRSMQAAFAAGADIVELDVHPTTDGHFAVIHDWTLDCRTEGTGETRSHDLAYLKTLDIGHGYTADGGKTWRRTLFRDDKTGGVDLSIDPKNPNVIFASLWEAHRTPWSMSSGGPGTGLFKSVDGGETWTEITRKPGLPSGVVGRIGVSVSGADSNRVYALVENERGGLFSSDDAGESWRELSAGLPEEPVYSSVLRDAMGVDDADPAGVYLGTRTGEVFASRDEGESWSCVVRHLPDVLSVRAAVVP